MQPEPKYCRPAKQIQNPGSTCRHARSTVEETINAELREHALDAEDWQYRDRIRWLHEWADRFNQAFRLGLRTPAIRLEPISSQRMGTYRFGRNGFGIRDEITLNSKYLNSPQADQLATLLHELLHEWQSLYGKPGRRNYHNREFQQKAYLYGLVVDARGRHVGIAAGRFTVLLAQYEIDFRSLPFSDPDTPPTRRTRRGESKLKKWSCGCTNVRCAVELAATCRRCGNLFQEAGPAW